MAELGALSLRIQAEGGEAVLAALRQIEAEAKTASSSTDQLSRAVSQQTERFSLLARTIDVTSQQQVGALRAMGAAQVQWMEQVGASENQQLRLAVAVQAFDRRVEASARQQERAAARQAAAQDTVTQARQRSAAAFAREKVESLAGLVAIERRVALLTRGAQIDATRADAVRRLITIEAALEKALLRTNLTVEQRIALNSALLRSQAGIATGTTQLVGALNRQGAAARTATATQAAQTAGFTIFGRAVTTTGGRLSAFSTRAIGGLNAAAFAMSSLASGGQASFRSLASAAAGFAAFFGPGGAIASIAVTAGLALTDFFTRTQREISETAQKAIDESKRVFAEIEQLRKGGEQPELIERARLLERDEIAPKRKQLADLETRIATLSGQASAQSIENKQKEAAATLALLRTAQQQRRQVSLELDLLLVQFGELRRAAIAIEQRPSPRGPTQVTTTAQGQKSAAALEKERRDAIAKTVAALGQLHQLDRQTGAQLVELQRVYADLHAELRRGNVTLERRAEIESQLATLRTAEVQQVEIQRTGASRQGPAIEIRVNEQTQAALDAARGVVSKALPPLNLELEQQLAQGLAAAISSGLTQGFAEGLAEGGLEGGFKSMLGTISAGFGGVFASMGQQVIAGSVLMQKAVAALSSLNPVAAIAAGIALTVLGNQLGGRRAGRQGFAAGASGSVAGIGPSSVNRLIVDPNARLHDVGARLPRLNAAGLQDQRPIQVIEVIGWDSPRGQQMIGTAATRYARRGG